jgi:hypothetical protein
MSNRHTEPRTIEHVERDLSYVRGGKTRNLLAYGRLLNEGKKFLVEQRRHGEWLHWLRRHTALHERTAQNYMKAATWADAWKAKYETVSFLPDSEFEGLAPKALYLLASANYSDDIVKKVLEATTSRPLNEDDVKDIAEAGTKAAIIREIEAEERAAQEAEAKAAGFETVEAWQAALEEEEAEAEARYQAEQQAAREAAQVTRAAAKAAEDAKIAAILAGPPDPRLPPPVAAPVAAPEFHVSTFDKAVEMLRSVMTKSLDAFAAVTTSPDTIEQVANFLREVGERRTRRP